MRRALLARLREAGNPYPRHAVRRTAWLNVGAPPVNQPTNDQTADPTEDEYGNELLSDDCVRKADQHAKDEPDEPTRPGRQVHTANDESDGKATGERTQKRPSFVRKRHRKHQANIQDAEQKSSDEAEEDF